MRRRIFVCQKNQRLPIDRYPLSVSCHVTNKGNEVINLIHRAIVLQKEQQNAEYGPPPQSPPSDNYGPPPSSSGGPY